MDSPQPDNFEIREPTPRDIHRFASMLLDVHETTDSDPSQRMLQQSVRVATIFCVPGEYDGNRVLVAIDQGSPAGWIRVKIDSPEVDRLGCLIHPVEVRPSQRRKGIARSLVDQATLQAHGNGQDIYAAVKESNKASINLFRDAGFQEVSNIGDFDEGVVLFVKRK